MMAEVNLAFTSSTETLDSSPVVERCPATEASASTDSGVQSETSFATNKAANHQNGHLPSSDPVGPPPSFLPPLRDATDPSCNTPPPWMLPPLTGPEAKEAPASEDCLPSVDFVKEVVTPSNLQEEDSEPPYLPTDCGCCCMCWKRSCLRKIAHPVSFLILISLVVLIQSFVVSGYTSSIATTIEKRYDIKTTWIGLIISTYDIACIFATLFVSYYANRMNRARFLGGSTLFLLFGLIIFTIPHFTGSRYSPMHVGPSRAVFMCNATSNADLLKVKKNQCDLQTTEPWAKYIFILAQVVIGIGASPIYIIGPTYLYDILHPLQYPIYSAFMYVAGALGPALGFVLGSSFLSVYIDWPKEAVSTMNKDHSQWLGAWWIGFLVAAGTGLLVALPLLAFPASFPDWLRARRATGEKIGCLAVAETGGGRGRAKERSERVKDTRGRETETDAVRRETGEGDAMSEEPTPSTSEADGVEVEEKKTKKSDEAEGYMGLKNMPKAIARIFVNPVWLFITLLSVEEQFVASAFIAFIQKYLQTMYGLPAYRASIVAGAVVIPSAVLGVMAGAVIIRQMRLNLLHAAYFLVGLCVVSTSLMIVLMFMGCDTFRMAGLRFSYNATHMPNVNFSSTCNTVCGCTGNMFSPVCDTATSTTFFSPCHAGCSVQSIDTSSGSPIFNFSSCACINHRSVTDGRCQQQCVNFVPSIILVFFVILVTALGQDPAHIITISSVASFDRSFGLGLQVLTIRLLAYVPAPIVFGHIFDSVCILWTRTCTNTEGSCQEHNLRLLPYVWIGVLVGLKILGIIFSSSLMMFSKKRANIAISVIVNEAEANKADAMGNKNQRVLDGTLPSPSEEPDAKRKKGQGSVTHVRVRRISSTTLNPRFAAPVTLPDTS